MAPLNQSLAGPAPSPFLDGARGAARAVGLRAERRSGATLAAVADAWRELGRRSLEPNIFAEPDFLVPAMAGLPGGGRVELLCVWREGARGGPRLAAAMPIVMGRDALGLRQARSWRPPLSSLGHPLVDAENPQAAIEALLDHLGGVAASLVLSQVPTRGAFAEALSAVASRTGRALDAFDAHERAVLLRGAGEGDLDIRKRTLKELRRQRRRLEDLGPVRVDHAGDPEAVAAALEAFLDLEARGWKGRRGTALAQDPRLAAVMGETVRGLAARGACRVDLLRVGEAVIAGTLLARSGDRAWFWKVAYDEAFARYSPGVQLTLDVTHDLLAAGEIAHTDSCAVQGHPMIDRLWRDRMAVADLLVGLRPRAPLTAAATRFGQTLARRARAAAKTAYHRLQGDR